nr:methylisocitrate lyase [Marinibactrum halimedae]
MIMTPGQRFRDRVTSSFPLSIVGVANAYTALMATKLGHQAIYLSGAGCANISYGFPDLGITDLHDVLTDVKRITDRVDTPLLVDIDTGWGGAFSIARTIKSMEKAGVAAVHIEDQVAAKRCGHRPNKAIVKTEEMVDRLKAAVDAREDPHFFIMARTDAYASEGLNGAIDRALAYKDAGADGIFAEAFVDIHDYDTFQKAVGLPVLANMTEFGVSPLVSRELLAEHQVSMVLYPLTAARAMHKAAESVYRHLLEEGDQTALLPTLQTRQELYEYLDYYRFEEKLDLLFSELKENKNSK